jgi:hypothetical protein
MKRTVSKEYMSGTVTLSILRTELSASCKSIDSSKVLTKVRTIAIYKNGKP